MNRTVLALLTSASFFTPVLSAEPSILPLPQKVQAQPGTLQLTPQTQIYYSEGLINEAKILAKQLRTATGFPFQLVPFKEKKASQTHSIILQLSSAAPAGKEAYRFNPLREACIFPRNSRPVFFTAHARYFNYSHPKSFHKNRSKR